MASSSKGTEETLPISIEKVIEFEIEPVHLCHDNEFLYIACQDNKVRVWEKNDWQLVATLESDDPLYNVHVDKENVYATSEKRVYVWSRQSWGMVGWFELSYQAVTSTMHNDSFLVGSKEGRLLSINKNTHETSSWQLYKSPLNSIWSDNVIICTGAKKGEIRIWQRANGQAPTEIANLKNKGRCTTLVGTSEFVFVGLSNGAIQIHDRADWSVLHTFKVKGSEPIVSLWANNQYLIAATAQGSIGIFDLKNGLLIGKKELDGLKIVGIDVDHTNLFIATSESIIVSLLLFGGTSIDIETELVNFETGVLKTSPYDVLESVLVRKRRGDEHFKDGKYHEAVSEYEDALQILIDNTHALLEVPKEREDLMNDINKRLGRALLHAKIVELELLNKRVEQISDEFDMRGRTELEEHALQQIWDEARRAIKESRVLAEAQSGDILSYQLSFIADTLEQDLKAAVEKAEKYKEKINQAKALVKNITAEWRWLERRRTTLQQRKLFLEGAVERLKKRLKESADEDVEVREILTSALEEFQKLSEQITRILEAANQAEEQELRNREEAIRAINGLLQVMPKKRDAVLAISDPDERKREYDKLVSVLKQALETAKRFKLKEESRNIRNEIDALESFISKLS